MFDLKKFYEIIGSYFFKNEFLFFIFNSFFLFFTLNKQIVEYILDFKLKKIMKYVLFLYLFILLLLYLFSNRGNKLDIFILDFLNQFLILSVFLLFVSGVYLVVNFFMNFWEKKFDFSSFMKINMSLMSVQVFLFVSLYLGMFTYHGSFMAKVYTTVSVFMFFGGLFVSLKISKKNNLDKIHL